MGWGNCGSDSTGRPIGYLFDAVCDFGACTEEIDRGLSYACGGMHGETEYGCEKYFCPSHLRSIGLPDGTSTQVCPDCYEFLDKEGLLDEDDEIIQVDD